MVALTTRLGAEADASARGDGSTAGDAEPHNPGDMAGDVVAREGALVVRVELLSDLKAVEAALRRLATGTYGRCIVCNERIPDERLETLPAASLCVAHQRLAERT